MMTQIATPTSEAGINTAAGSQDDGWAEPPAVVLADGTSVQLYKDGQALQIAYRAMENACTRICLEVYIFSDDTIGSAFADLLIAKAKAGLSVNVMYDSWGSMNTSRDFFVRLQRGGVKVQQFNPLRPWECKHSWRFFNRNHRKLLLIDNDIAWLGGMNIAGEYAGSWVVPGSPASRDPWRDNAIGIRGPSSIKFLRAFARSWNYCHSGGRVRRAEFIHELSANTDDEIGLIASVPTTDSPLRTKIHAFLDGAKSSIQMTMAYFAPDDGLVDALCRASKRGVHVQLMLPARSDVNLLLIAARSFYEKLLQSRVQIFERQHAVLHAKMMCVDQHLTVIGSTNLDYRSIEYNLELSAIVRSNQLGHQMYELFDNDIRYSKEIQLRDWRKRPTMDRIGQWAVSRARYLL